MVFPVFFSSNIGIDPAKLNPSPGKSGSTMKASTENMMPDSLNEKEKLQLFKEWNRTEKDYPLGKCLQAFIEEQVAKTPFAAALIYEGKILSYEDLNRQANRLAHYLKSRGVAPEKLVGICAYRSAEMVIGLLAILKAGGAYVPFDPTLPPNRLAFMINDSKASVILAQKSCQSALSQASADIIYFEDIVDALEAFSTSNPKNEANPDNLAYVIYTSGSTGNPKGAMNTHKGIVNRLLWMQDTFQIGPADTLIQKTPFSFDVSVWEFFWPFMFGARLVVAKPEGHKDSEYLLDLIAREKVTVIHFVPSMLRLFLEAADPRRCASLQHVVLSGEAVTIDLQQRYFSVLKAPLHNLYGPTEAAVDVTYWKCDPSTSLPTVPIGRPISNIRLYILDKAGRPLSVAESGELHIGGVGVGRGYLNRPELTAEKFIKDPFSDDPSARLYKTGDLCRYLPDGNIDYIGRIDFQVKIRGNRIELGEIETVIQQDASVRQCAVTAREDSPGEKRLVAYIVEVPGKFSISGIRKLLAEKLPDYMIPAAFVLLPSLPLTPSGKTDRRALPKPGHERPELANPYIAPRTETEKKLSLVWRDVLQLDRVGIDDNFFDLGGDSLMALKMVSRLHGTHRISLPVVKLFEHPSVARLGHFLDHRQDTVGFIDEINERATRQRIGRFHNDLLQDGVAIVGMAGRFPGAAAIDQLWDNLCNDVESISWFSKEELAPGIDAALRDDPDYVPARGIIADADKFDAAFFGIGPQEARVMDPQQRVFLELAWSALENAGYDSQSFDGMIGVYAGVGDNHYYPTHVLSNPDLVNMVGKVIVGYGNEKDYIATRVSYALDLTGPSVSVNTGCSTALLAVDMAFRALIDHECDIALAGGVDIFVPQKSGFLYQPGGIFSKDGHCRPFDSQATGTMFCDGAGVLVLKRMSAALSDGDRIYAVIRGTAKNNDGANKASFLAPSVEGQARVIAMAQAQANVLPQDISYIEAHGTGTPLGDPIEVEALTKVWRAQTDRKQTCWLGCIKGHIGHPTIAAGVAGLIKASLCLYHEKIPGTLHFRSPNPQIDFDNSPFKVVDRLTPYPRSNKRRIAAVSSFGFGGTNVHTILEEPPIPVPSGSSRPKHLLLISAKTETALDQASTRLKSFLEQHPDTKMSDAAFTLQRGRRYFAKRRFFVCGDRSDALELLGAPDPTRSQARTCDERDPDIAFMFPGQGSQYVNMGKNLYDHERLFRETVDHCCEILKSHLDCDLRDFLYPEEGDTERAAQSLTNTFYTQPALFTIEYALARLLQHWGIAPSAMIGHSVGEFVCACLAGVFSLEDAARLVAVRGRLIQGLPGGSMLTIRGHADEIQEQLPASIQLAAVNSPSLCVVSGPSDAIHQFQKELDDTGTACKLLHTSHAFHSAMMDPVVARFTQEVSSAERQPPKIPFISTVTGSWISDQQATDPSYWGRHLRMPVRFSHGICELLKKDGLVFVEVGPRTTCATLMRQHATLKGKAPVTATLSETHLDDAEWTALLSALGYLWLHGVSIDWRSFYSDEHRQRVPLPAYPFERRRYWVDPVERAAATKPPVAATRFDDIDLKLGESPDLERTQGSADSLTRELVRSIEETAGFSLDGVGPSATFLELGMDSLLLSQLAYKIKRDFGVKIVFSQLMQKLSTVSLLVEHIRKQSPNDTGKEDADENPEPGAQLQTPPGPDRAPLTVPQKGLWLSSKLCDELSCAYNESITLHVTGDIEVSLLEQAIAALVQRHDALRASFSPDGSAMAISPDAAFELRRIDLNSMDTAQAGTEFTALLRKDAATAFDLEHGPLFRAYIVAMPGNQFHVVLTSHHIVCDGWSLDVLISELCNFYNALSRKQEIRLESSATFAEFARSVDRRRGGKEFESARSYWVNRFSGSFPVLSLPVENSQQLGSYDAQRMDLDISGKVVSDLRDACRRKGWSPFTVLVAAYNITLHRISGQRDFVIGLPTAEQPLIGKDDLVGHCVNLIPFRFSLESADTYAAYVNAVQQDLIEAYDHQIYTFVDLLAESALARTGSSPLPAGMTHVKKYAENELGMDHARVDYFANPRAYESFQLYLNVVESAAAFELKCHFRKSLFKPDTVRTWLELYRDTLAKIAANPEADIDRPIPHQGLRLPQTPVVRTAAECRDETTNQLLRVWQRVFGNPSVGPQDNFFQLGGHSLLAARLFAEIEKDFGKTLPLSSLFHAPTAAQMARLLHQEVAFSDWQPLVPIRASGTRPPLFLVHGAEGNILMYRDLAKHLGADQPVFGLQSRGLDNKTEINGDFEEVAATYLKAIKQQQHKGPYFIGGYCLGGTLALEIAQQLKRQGEEVGLLFMIENYNIQTLKWPLPVHVRMANGFLNAWYHVANLFAFRNRQKWVFFKTKLNTEISRIKISMLVSSSSVMKAVGVKAAFDFPHVRVNKVYDEALTRYRPKAFEGEMVLFGAQKQLAGFKDPLYGWSDIAMNGIELFALPVKPRGSLVEPYVRNLAQNLRNCMDKRLSGHEKPDALGTIGANLPHQTPLARSPQSRKSSGKPVL